MIGRCNLNSLESSIQCLAGLLCYSNILGPYSGLENQQMLKAIPMHQTLILCLRVFSVESDACYTVILCVNTAHLGSLKTHTSTRWWVST